MELAPKVFGSVAPQKYPAQDLAYIAGIIDGEGHVGISRDKGKYGPRYRAVTRVCMVDDAAIRFISERFGGSFYQRKRYRDNPRWSDIYRYCIADKAAETLLRAIEAFVLVKRELVRTVLEYRDLQNQGASYRTKVTCYNSFPNMYGSLRWVERKAYSDEYLQMSEKFYLKCRQLNCRGRKRCGTEYIQAGGFKIAEDPGHHKIGSLIPRGSKVEEDDHQ